MGNEHWAHQKELGGGRWQFRLILSLFRFLGPGFVGFFTRPLVLFFYLSAASRRGYSREFLNQVRTRLPGDQRMSVLRHFQAFASSLVDKMAGWAGIIKLDSLSIDGNGGFEDLVDQLRQGKGALALCSHLGNVEILRALGSLEVEDGQNIPDFRILAIVEFGGTGKYNEMLESLESSSMEGIIPVEDIGPDTMIRIRDFVEAGGLVVVAGDRIAPDSDARSLEMNFLGRKARFPYGSYYLADLLEAPVYTVFALRDNDISLKSRYCFHIRKMPVIMGGGRRNRDERIRRLATSFVGELETMVLHRPYQWFNFYSFWN